MHDFQSLHTLLGHTHVLPGRASSVLFGLDLLLLTGSIRFLLRSVSFLFLGLFAFSLSQLISLLLLSRLLRLFISQFRGFLGFQTRLLLCTGRVSLLVVATTARRLTNLLALLLSAAFSSLSALSCLLLRSRLGCSLFLVLLQITLDLLQRRALFCSKLRVK